MAPLFVQSVLLAQKGFDEVTFPVCLHQNQYGYGQTKCH